LYSTMKWIGAITTALLLSPFLVACGGGSGSTGSTGIGASVPTRDTVLNFNVTVATDKTTYNTGDQINITVSATNTGSSPQTLSYPYADQIVHWGYIIAQNGKIVAYEYNSAHKQILPTAISVDQYAVGETKTFSYVFPYQPADKIQTTTLPAGTYQVYARQADLTYNGAQAIRHTIPTPASDPVTITVN
jgi:hypothetical protein